MKEKIVLLDSKIGSDSCFFVKLDSESILERLLKTAQELPFKQIILCTEETDRTVKFIEQKGFNREIISVVRSLSEQSDAVILEANFLYDTGKLIRLIKKDNQEFSSAVLWELKKEGDIAPAEATLQRMQNYPVARYINLPLGKSIANVLAKTSVSPNQVSFISLILGMLSGFCFISNVYIAVFWGALLLQFHCTLDFADGHLARLKDKVSKTGALWDGIVNKTVELFCYAGISYGLFLKYNCRFFFAIGMATMFGYFMIDYYNFLKTRYLQEDIAGYAPCALKPHLKAIKKVYWFIEQWDVRLLIISIFAILNRLEFALTYFALDFNFRWLFNVTREMVSRKRQRI